jgi:hypothetical protein
VALPIKQVTWAGVGKSTLVNHWLRRMATDHYRSAELIFGWSFYRQGTSGGTSPADEFIDAALHWFGDPDSRLGTAWEKGAAVVGLDLSASVEHQFERRDYLGIRCDVTDESALQSAFDLVAEKYGGLDMLVLDAGISRRAGGC